MKIQKSIQILVLLMLGLAASAFADSTSTVKRAYPKQHRGFYNSMDFGVSYIDAKTYEEPNNSGYHDEDSFSGFGFPLMEFRFGAGVANLITLYTQFNFGLYYFGSSEGKEIYCGTTGVCETEEKEAENILGRTYVGVGASIYPFRDTSSVMNGFFFGGSSGYSFEGLGLPQSLDYAFTLEVGKDWWVDDELSFGLSFSYFHAFPQYDVKKSESYINGFHILFRITRG